MSATETGAVLNSAIYLLSIVAASLVWHLRDPVFFAIAAMGFTFLSYCAQEATVKPGIGVFALALSSQALGAVAGIVLLFEGLMV